MKKIFKTASLLGIAVLASCSENDNLIVEQQPDLNPNSSYIHAIAARLDTDTRSVIEPNANGYSFKWSEGDQIAVYAAAENTGLTNFDLIEGADSDNATFKSNGFKFIEGADYYAFTPYNGNCTDKTSISLDYTGQCQVANGDYLHLGAKDFQAAAAQVAPVFPDYPTFAFKHVGALTRFVVTVPSADVYTQATFTSPSLVTKGSYNLVSGNFAPASVDSHTIVLDLGNGGDGINMAADDKLTLYMMMAPQDLSAETIEITLATKSGTSVRATANGKNLVSAKPYGFNATVIPDYLCFTALYNNTTVSFGRGNVTYNDSPTYSGDYYPTLEYSRDGLNWQSYTIDEEIVLANVGDKVYWRGNNVMISKKPEPSADGKEKTNYNKFFSSNQVAGSGNVMSLLDKTCKSTTITEEECFAYLFYGRDYKGGGFHMTTCPKLPATQLSTACYSHMFAEHGASVLPEILPAMTLAERCYEYMFYYGMAVNSKLPKLPATTLAKECYKCMFCNSDFGSYCDEDILLPATVLAEGCYRSMFSEVYLGTAKVILPATTLAKECYAYMFESGINSYINDCNLPDLPATTLAEGCYKGMFYYCKNITKAPELPATTLVKDCYQRMFDGCSNLIEVKAAFTTEPSSETTSSWLSGTAANGTFYKNAVATWDVTGKDGVPEGWTIKTYTPTY